MYIAFADYLFGYLELISFLFQVSLSLVFCSGLVRWTKPAIFCFSHQRIHGEGDVSSGPAVCLSVH